MFKLDDIVEIAEGCPYKSHRAFGRGTVVEVTQLGSPPRLLYSVKFRDGAIRDYLNSYLKLISRPKPIVCNISKHIESIGAEFECGINSSDYRKVDEYIKENNLDRFFSAGGDGSVSVSGKTDGSAEIRFWNGNLQKFLDFSKVLYEQGKIRTNDSCGCHIHLRFKKDSYAFLSYMPNINEFLKEYEAFSNTKTGKDKDKFLKRLHQHCCRADMSEADVVWALNRGGDRYRAVNFCSLWEPQRSVEFRIFPGHDSYEEFKESVDWLIMIVEKLISSNKELRTYINKLNIPGEKEVVTLEYDEIKNEVAELTISKVSDLRV